MDVYLWLVCACAHDPVAIFTDSNAVARFFELKILQQLDPVLVFRVVLQAALPGIESEGVELQSGGRLKYKFNGMVQNFVTWRK